jgi:predicted unusual protein kinase regulating ubiquinone biosynthesis (AarF/ABC1/UbiB family)
MLADVQDVHVPTPIAELTTPRLLTMTWLEGAALQRWLDTDPPLEARNRVAEALFRAWYVPFYHYGVIHGDPHLGNYQVRPDGGVNLLDYGAIRVFPAIFVRGVIDLFEAIRDNDEAKAGEAYRNWGFSDITPQKVAVLNGWARFLYEPLLDDRVRRIQETDGQFGRSVAEEVHSGLKSIGGVRPPREFVLMDRSAVGLGSVFLRLRAELNWSRLYHEVTKDFDTDRLVHRQAEALSAAGVPPPK